MKAYKSILSILLLGIYSVVVLHNMVPHFHCDTDSKIASTESAHMFHAGMHHSHNHDSHDHEKDESESGWLDTFMALLGDLEHHELGDGHFENFTVQSQSISINIATIDFIDNDILGFSPNIIYTFEPSDKNDFIDRIPIIYEQQQICSSPLRGPPTIS